MISALLRGLPSFGSPCDQSFPVKASTWTEIYYHSPPPQPKVNIICQSLHQEEIIQELTMKLRHIGDSIDHRMAQEALQQEGRDALAHFVFIFFGGVHGLLRFLWNNHLV
ncbi:Peroxisomal testis-specific protein 1 [Manis javanica]|nr:Peroxisomal testis-specific protein 1 [Manis javanica]